MFRCLIFCVIIIHNHLAFCQTSKKVYYEKQKKADLFFQESNYRKSCDLAFDVLRYADSIQDHHLKALAKLRIAAVYSKSFSNFEDKVKRDKAKKYAWQALNSARHLKDSFLIYRAYTLLSNVEDNFKESSNAISYLDSSLVYLDSTKHIESYALTLFNKSSIYLDRKDYINGIPLSFELLDLYRGLEDSSGIIDVYTNLGVFHEFKKDYKKAIDYYTIVVEYSDRTNKFSNLYFASLGLFYCYNYLGDKENVIYYHEINNYASSKLQEQASSNSILELETKYETQKKEQQILLQKARLEKSKALQAKTNVFVFALIVFLLLISSLFFFRSRFLRHKRQFAEFEIERKNKEIESVIQRQETVAIEAQLKGELEERKRIASDLHDRVGGLLSTINIHLNAENEDESHVQNKKQIHDLVKNSIQEVRTISHNLYQAGTLSELNEHLKQLELGVNASNVVSMKVFNELFNQYIPELVVLELIKVIQELVTNTMKHANAKQIEIQLIMLPNQQLHVIYEDDGIGFDIDNVKNGLGTTTLKKRIDRCRGELTFDSKIGRGTTVIINIPISDESTNHFS